MELFSFSKSISNELIATKDRRVRNIIENRHWGEEGRTKRSYFDRKETLKKRLPKNISVGTGFIINHHLISTQIDIIIYRNENTYHLTTGRLCYSTFRCCYGCN